MTIGINLFDQEREQPNLCTIDFIYAAVHFIIKLVGNLNKAKIALRTYHL